MLRCHWQDTVPVLEASPFEPEDSIMHQAEEYKASLPDIDLVDSTVLSPEEAVKEAARLNAENAIRVAGTLGRPMLVPSQSARSQAGTRQLPMQKPSDWSSDAQPSGLPGRKAAQNWNLKTIEQNLMGGGTSTDGASMGRMDVPAKYVPPAKTGLVMPMGTRGETAAEARAFLRKLSSKSNQKPQFQAKVRDFDKSWRAPSDPQAAADVQKVSRISERDLEQQMLLPSNAQKDGRGSEAGTAGNVLPLQDNDDRRSDNRGARKVLLLQCVQLF